MFNARRCNRIAQRAWLHININSLFSMGFSTVMLPYGDDWRLHRKLFLHAFPAESEARNREVYLRRARTLLANLLDIPEDFEAHIRRQPAVHRRPLWPIGWSSWTTTMITTTNKSTGSSPQLRHYLSTVLRHVVTI
ncbi:hypothetical protein L210DRAFT_3204191 [Boletus edulis BED1]|uniref:Cytochrome P450 n=1 Tax=Boletus edulis BED1 TaxID=1328754 RepID=A0AAD4BWW6_BOLED|nr:hypothetical protein L210DRAFT_3204191 [Boletus edulis BED1]